MSTGFHLSSIPSTMGGGALCDRLTTQPATSPESNQQPQPPPLPEHLQTPPVDPTGVRTPSVFLTVS